MADTKISALPASTVPLAGTEVLPIVQSSTTKQVSVANLTAGRAVSALSLTTATVQATNSSGLALKNSGGTTQLSVGAGGGDNITLGVATSITDNIIQGTAAKGVNFTANTPASGMTSQLLNWYEEGTFTPVLRDGSTGNAAAATAIGRYTRIGRAVQIQIELTAINTTGLTPTNTIYITGLPFLCVSTYTPADVFGDTVASTTGQLQGLLYTNSFLMVLYNNTVTGHTAAIVSQLTSGTSAFFIQANYITS